MYYLHLNMSIIRKLIPASIKLSYRLNQRRRSDRISGNNKLFAKEFADPSGFYPVVIIVQPVKTTAASLNKVHNLSLAIAGINNITIKAGEIFSFWELVGNPSQKNGYQKSRSIINGKLEAAVGGGLCQLSGLIYFLAICSGLKITERHAHSIDIYREEERFTPLGSDATVNYGYKDLRFLNQYNFPVAISLELTGNNLTGKIGAKEKIDPCNIRFEYRESTTYTEADTIAGDNGNVAIIASNRYKKLL